MGSDWIQVRGHFLVKDGNKTLGFGFCTDRCEYMTIFASRVYPNQIHLFLTHFFTNPTGTQNPTGAGMKFHPRGCGCNFPFDSISS
jgi:hypothetical protein